MSVYNKIIDQQKLTVAWKKVMSKKPACGTDHVTWKMFDQNSRTEIRQLNLELTEHVYSVQPVKLVRIVKEEKEREISLYTMRDKIVQTSIAAELSKLFEASFSKCAYAYRNDRSALMAVEAIDQYIQSHAECWAGKMDIQDFFDSISQERLKKKLEAVIKEEDTLDLIMKQLQAPFLNRNGVVEKKEAGLYQGSSLSPILSNIFMAEFDRVFEKERGLYIRYSDDLLFLSTSYILVQNTLKKMHGLLEDLDLKPNESKTCIRKLADGILFLGYSFDHKGRAVPEKARKKLSQTLEDLWLTTPGLDVEERLKKGSQAINGWKQYYQKQKEIHNIYEYTVLIYLKRGTSELKEFSKRRPEFINSYRDITSYLLSVWKENGWTELELFEYEQYYRLGNKIKKINTPHFLELINLYETLLVNETEENWRALMQTYSDLGMHETSEKIMERIQALPHEQALWDAHSETVSIGESFIPSCEPQILRCLSELFVGREDQYCREILTSDGKRRSEYVPEPLEETVLKKHLSGTETIETFVVRNNDTVHYLAVDVDISRKILLQIQHDSENLEAYLKLALKWSGKVQDTLKKMGLETSIEFSGFRGYHVWLLFSEWVPIRYIYTLADIVKTNLSDPPAEIQIEFFPSKMKRQQGSGGQKLKLPYGLHLCSGKRSYLCQRDGTPITEPEKFLNSAKRYTVAQLKQAVAANISSSKETPREHKKCELDYKKLGAISDSVKQILQGCSLMRYLAGKAVTTGYLTHSERMSILYVFGHVGEDGKQFVHTIMSFTMNYQYAVTQKFIGKLLSKPISCVKLREQYKAVTAEYGCNCVFTKTSNCYPSPVIHALKNSMDDENTVTIPTSRTISKEKQQDIYQEINVHVRVQELASKIVELKKQKRGLDRAIEKTEKELCGIYDSIKTDCMEVDMGLLVRRKMEKGYEWLIEI